MSSSKTYSHFNNGHRQTPWKNESAEDPFSTKTWDEFKRRSRKLTEETNEIWRNMESSSSSVSMTSSERKPSKEDFPPWRRSQSLHRNENKRRIRFGDENTSNSSSPTMDLGQIRDDEGVFEVSVDVSPYAPSELEVSVGSNRVLMIKGRHEDDRVARTFNRKFSLPHNCLLDKISPRLRPSRGTLVITVPKSPDEVPLNAKAIPLIIKD